MSTRNAQATHDIPREDYRKLEQELKLVLEMEKSLESDKWLAQKSDEQLAYCLLDEISQIYGGRAECYVRAYPVEIERQIFCKTLENARKMAKEVHLRSFSES